MKLGHKRIELISEKSLVMKFKKKRKRKEKKRGGCFTLYINIKVPSQALDILVYLLSIKFCLDGIDCRKAR